MPNLISPEITRLAQLKAKQAGVDIQSELARTIVEDAVIELDPELDLVVNTVDTYNEIVGFAKAAGANDVIINDRHFDVRVLLDNGTVEINRALIGTQYLSTGSLVVSLQSTEGGAVVGFVGPGAWLSAEQQSRGDRVTLKFEQAANFDLGSLLVEVCNKVQVNIPTTVKTLPNESELLSFISNRDNVIAARQKQIAIAIMTDLSVRSKFEELQTTAQKAERVVNDAAIWNQRVEDEVQRVSGKFAALNQNDLRTAVRKTGEIYGGQPESPMFRAHMVNSLVREQLAKKFAGLSTSKLTELIDNVASGKAPVEAVKSLVNNKIAVDIAAKIKSQRKQAAKFVSATAEEIGMAFSQLSLQTSYATHSSADSGVESINEALQLLEAAELAEQARKAIND